MRLGDALKEQIAAHDARARAQMEEQNEEHTLAFKKLRSEKDAEIEAIEKKHSEVVLEKGQVVLDLAKVSSPN